MVKIDVCIVAARRPDLLERTLSSFFQNLIRNFSINRVIVNIDPLFGDDHDHERCISVLKSYFGDPPLMLTVRSPEQPGFCAAVKKNWLATTTDYILHLEDDWLLNRPVHADILHFFQDKRVTQVSFLSKEKYWDTRRKGYIHAWRRRPKIFGIKLPYPKTTLPLFTTSPSFLRGSFARKAASLMIERLDPEKQFFTHTNPELQAYVAPYRNRLHGDDIIVTDIGRTWRAERKIEKAIIDGSSVWTAA